MDGSALSPFHIRYSISCQFDYTFFNNYFALPGSTTDDYEWDLVQMQEPINIYWTWLGLYPYIKKIQLYKLCHSFTFCFWCSVREWRGPQSGMGGFVLPVSAGEGVHHKNRDASFATRGRRRKRTPPSAASPFSTTKDKAHNSSFSMGTSPKTGAWLTTLWTHGRTGSGVNWRLRQDAKILLNKGENYLGDLPHLFILGWVLSCMYDNN